MSPSPVLVASITTRKIRLQIHACIYHGVSILSLSKGERSMSESLGEGGGGGGGGGNCPPFVCGPVAVILGNVQT